MSDDAEWIDVDNEFGVVGVRPRFPPSQGPTTTVRPFWISSTTRRPTPRRTTPRRTTPSTPDVFKPGNPINPYPAGSGSPPHDAPERVAPSTGPGPILYGVIGGVMTLVVVAVVIGGIFLAKKYRKNKQTENRPVNRQNNAVEDYRTRVEDVANLSTPLDDSSQLYVNTSDLHKLMSSVKAARKNPPQTTPISTHSVGRPKFPSPEEQQNRNNFPMGVERRIQSVSSHREPARINSNDSVVNTALNRLSGKFSSIGMNIQNTWKQAKSFRDRAPSRTNEAYESSMPDVVPDATNINDDDDDDIWSEDSFDSCSIGYENETTTGYPSSRQGSTRRSLRHTNLNDSKRRKPIVGQSKKINPPSMPPPPPPTQANNATAIIIPNAHLMASHTNSSSTFSDRSSPYSSGDYTVVRKAPLPPVGVAKKTTSSLHPSNEHKTNITQVHDSKTHLTNTHTPGYGTPSKNFPAPLTSLPKPKVISPKNKPSPPSGPKPTAKPQLLPKLKIGLRVPQPSTESAPDTAMTVLSATLGIDGQRQASDRNIFGNVTKGNASNMDASSPAEADHSNLTVSQRRAMLEGLNFGTPKTPRR